MRFDDGSGVLERSRTAGCVAFPDAARLAWTRRIFRSPPAAQGEDNVNKAELLSDVAAETSTIRAAAERMVGAVFSSNQVLRPSVRWRVLIEILQVPFRVYESQLRGTPVTNPRKGTSSFGR